VEHWFSAQVEESLQGSLKWPRPITGILPPAPFPPLNRSVSPLQTRHDQRITRNEPAEGAAGGKTTGAPSQYPRNIFQGRKKRDRSGGSVLKPLSLRLPKDLLEAGFSGKEVSKILSVGEGELIPASPPFSVLRREGRWWGSSWPRIFIPKSLTVKMHEISQAFMEYKQLKILKKPIKLAT